MAQGNGVDASERHQAEAAKLRAEVQLLVKRARLLLHGEPNAARPPAPRAPHPRRAEREREMEQALEKADWYRREIKRMRQELESRDHHSNLSNPWPADSRDRDPMELYNLLAERRKELQQIHRVTEGLDRAAEAQRKAENAQSAVRPEIEERLRKAKDQVEQQKRLNVKLQADRLKLSTQRKAAEEELRTAGSELRSKAALLHRPPRPGHGGGTPEKGSEEQVVLKQLRREVDILRGAVRQDERKHRAMLKEDSQEVDFATAHVQSLQKSIEEREALVAKLKLAITPGSELLPDERPPPADPTSPFRGDETVNPYTGGGQADGLSSTPSPRTPPRGKS